MAIAIDPREQFDYVLKADRALPAEKQTVFKLRALTFGQRAALENMPTLQGEEVMPRLGSVKREILRAGLAGWSNLRNSKGEEIEFATDIAERTVLGVKCKPVIDSCLERLHPHDVMELVDAITEVQRITDEEGKD